MKRQSRLRRRIREWLKKKKELKKEKPLPSFAKSWMDRHQEDLERQKEFYKTVKPNGE